MRQPPKQVQLAFYETKSSLRGHQEFEVSELEAIAHGAGAYIEYEVICCERQRQQEVRNDKQR